MSRDLRKLGRFRVEYVHDGSPQHIALILRG